MLNNEINKNCGKRVRIAITLCGMKLPAFGKKYKVSFSHLYAIEKGERSLTQKMAGKIADGVRQEGYSCTVKWLLKGEGIPPLKEEIKTGEFDESGTLLSVLSPELKIMKEASFFQQLYNNSIVCCVLDDGMEPFYSIGDYVGGLFSTNLKDSVGKDCIIITQEGEQLVRRLFKGSKTGLYNLACMNPFTKKSSPVLFDHTIKTAAPIIWHRRRHY